jgi:hypothetical protein
LKGLIKAFTEHYTALEGPYMALIQSLAYKALERPYKTLKGHDKALK